MKNMQINIDTIIDKDLIPSPVFKTEAVRLSSLLKWPGGKEQELKYILPNLPSNFCNYYEPFVGGGAVYAAMNANRYFINDKSTELILLYKSIIGYNRDIFFDALDEIIHNWDLLAVIVEKNDEFFKNMYRKFSQDKITKIELKKSLFKFIFDNSNQFIKMFSNVFAFGEENFIKELQVNLFRKIKRMKEIEKKKCRLPSADIVSNIEAALKSAYYMQFRYLYNNITKFEVPNHLHAAIFLVVRNFAYSGMFRYNSKGDFNVPYGGIGYNKKNLRKKIDYLKSCALEKLLKETTIKNLDFEDFFYNYTPRANDFVFLDPPYDTEFSTYAKNDFTKKDQARLASYLIKNCRAKWMIVIKNTEYIHSLYEDKRLNIKSFNKTYLVSFMNRNNKNAEHLLITNY